MPTSFRDESELLRRAREGDDRAFRELVHRYEDRVAATIIGMLGPGPDAEDVGQETFIRLYRSLDGFRGDSSLATYVTRIAINQSLKAIRRRKSWTRRFIRRDSGSERVEGLEGTDTRELPDTGLERDELVRIGLESLTPEQRAVVLLRLIDGYSTRETANILGIAEGTVLSRLSRGLAAMRTKLAPHMRANEDPRRGAEGGAEPSAVADQTEAKR